MVVDPSLCGLFQHCSMIHFPYRTLESRSQLFQATLPENQPLPLHDNHSAGIGAWGKGPTCLQAGFWGVNGHISSLLLLSPNALQLLYPKAWGRAVWWHEGSAAFSVGFPQWVGQGAALASYFAGDPRVI